MRVDVAAVAAAVVDSFATEGLAAGNFALAAAAGNFDPAAAAGSSEPDTAAPTAAVHSSVSAENFARAAAGAVAAAASRLASQAHTPACTLAGEEAEAGHCVLREESAAVAQSADIPRSPAADMSIWVCHRHICLEMTSVAAGALAPTVTFAFPRSLAATDCVMARSFASFESFWSERAEYGGVICLLPPSGESRRILRMFSSYTPGSGWRRLCRRTPHTAAV